MTEWEVEEQRWDPSQAWENYRARAGALERRLRAAAIALAVALLGTAAIGTVLLIPR